MAVLLCKEQLRAHLVNIVNNLAINRYELIAIAETHTLGALVKDITPLNILVGHIRLAIGVTDASIDHHRKQDVHHNTRNHHHKALPRGLCAELPRLNGGLHLLEVHTLVDHTSNLHIATQRQPAYAILGLATLPLEERKPRIEEDIKFLNANLKDTRHNKMSKLVNRHKK